MDIFIYNSISLIDLGRRVFGQSALSPNRPLSPNRAEPSRISRRFVLTGASDILSFCTNRIVISEKKQYNLPERLCPEGNISPAAGGSPKTKIRNQK